MRIKNRVWLPALIGFLGLATWLLLKPARQISIGREAVPPVPELLGFEGGPGAGLSRGVVDSRAFSEPRRARDPLMGLELKGVLANVSREGGGRVFGTWSGGAGTGRASRSVRAVRHELASALPRVLGVTNQDGDYDLSLAGGTYDIVFGDVAYTIEVTSGSEIQLNHREVITEDLIVRVDPGGLHAARASVQVRWSEEGGGAGPMPLGPRSV